MKVLLARSKMAILVTIFVVASFVLCSCKSSGTPTLDLIVPVVHGTGGIDGEAYLNCQESFELFKSKGYKYFEVDFAYTSDGILVCSHKFDYLADFGWKNKPTYEEFCNTLVAGKYHTMTIDWLAMQLRENPDIKIIFDTKQSNKVQVSVEVYNQLQKLQVDTKNQYIVQMYYSSDWDILKDLELNDIWFTNYKANYTQQKIIDLFGDNSAISSVILSEENFLQFAKEGIVIPQKIGVHYGAETLNWSMVSKYKIDYLYVNYWTELGDKS